MYIILTQNNDIRGKHPRRMSWHLAHVETGIFFQHWIYVQTPIIRILKCDLNPGIAAVCNISDSQQGEFIGRTPYPHNLYWQKIEKKKKTTLQWIKWIINCAMCMWTGLFKILNWIGKKYACNSNICIEFHRGNAILLSGTFFLLDGVKPFLWIYREISI